jgi:hypothetical protein
MISQTITTSFKQNIFQGVQNLSTNTIYMALYTGSADLGAETTVYTTLAEVVGTGYVAGGKPCQNITVNTSGTVVYVSFNNVVWTGAAFTCRGALIYNQSQGNKSIAVLNFGADKTATSSFTVTLPANSADSALIRV